MKFALSVGILLLALLAGAVWLEQVERGPTRNLAFALLALAVLSQPFLTWFGRERVLPPASPPAGRGTTR